MAGSSLLSLFGTWEVGWSSVGRGVERTNANQRLLHSVIPKPLMGRGVSLGRGDFFATLHLYLVISIKVIGLSSSRSKLFKVGL